MTGVLGNRKGEDLLQLGSVILSPDGGLWLVFLVNHTIRRGYDVISMVIRQAHCQIAVLWSQSGIWARVPIFLGFEHLNRAPTKIVFIIFPSTAQI